MYMACNANNLRCICKWFIWFVDDNEDFNFWRQMSWSKNLIYEGADIGDRPAHQLTPFKI